MWGRVQFSSSTMSYRNSTTIGQRRCWGNCRQAKWSLRPPHRCHQLPGLNASRFAPFVNLYQLSHWMGTPALKRAYQEFMCQHRMPPDSTYELDVSMSPSRTQDYEFLAACGAQRGSHGGLRRSANGRERRSKTIARARPTCKTPSVLLSRTGSGESTLPGRPCSQTR